MLYPFFAFTLLIAFVVYYSRGGRPIKMNIRGLGISFSLTSIDETVNPQDGTTKVNKT